jgi:hypothetical protein
MYSQRYAYCKENINIVTVKIRYAGTKILPHCYKYSVQNLTYFVTTSCHRLLINQVWGTRWRRCLGHCATNRKVMGSVPRCGHLSGLLQKRVPRIPPWGIRLTTLLPSRADCLEIVGDSTSWSRKLYKKWWKAFKYHRIAVKIRFCNSRSL